MLDKKRHLRFGRSFIGADKLFSGDIMLIAIDEGVMFM